MVVARKEHSEAATLYWLRLLHPNHSGDGPERLLEHLHDGRRGAVRGVRGGDERGCVGQGNKFS